jgi:hypothetical protein
MKRTLTEPVERVVSDLRELRDEIRLNLHLFGMEAKDLLAGHATLAFTRPSTRVSMPARPKLWTRRRPPPLRP